MITAVFTWKCKCGADIKVVGETNGNRPVEQIAAPCPNCGDIQMIYAYQIVSITHYIDTKNSRSRIV